MKFLTIVFWFIQGIKEVVDHFLDERKDPGQTGKSPWITMMETIVASAAGWLLADFLSVPTNIPVIVAVFIVGMFAASPTKTIAYIIRNLITGAFFYLLLQG